jgi:hypothetical protein
MPPLKPSEDWLNISEMREASWTAAEREFIEGHRQCRNLAEQIVYVYKSHHGLKGAILYIRDRKADRKHFREAAETFRRVGGKDFESLAFAIDYVIKTKPKPPPPWKARMAAKHKRRTKELRKKKASNHR